jgi:hypothetical protein
MERAEIVIVGAGRTDMVEQTKAVEKKFPHPHPHTVTHTYTYIYIYIYIYMYIYIFIKHMLNLVCLSLNTSLRGAISTR